MLVKAQVDAATSGIQHWPKDKFVASKTPWVAYVQAKGAIRAGSARLLAPRATLTNDLAIGW